MKKAKVMYKGWVIEEVDLDTIISISESSAKIIDSEGREFLSDSGLPVHAHDFANDRWSIRRFNITLAFLEKHIPGGSTILDLGTVNGLGNFLASKGYKVTNTQGEDFDYIRPLDLWPYGRHDAITAFEIFEHLIDPFCLLRSLPDRRLVASVPLRLWFTPAYRGRDGNLAGRHYHEFEDWQFLWLLDKAGWRVVDSIKITSPSFTLGLRTLLRWATPRYLFVYAEKK